MAKVPVNIPPYDLQGSFENTFALRGVVQGVNQKGLFFKKRQVPQEPVDSANRRVFTLVPAIDKPVIQNIYTLINNVDAVRAIMQIQGRNPYEWRAGVGNTGDRWVELNTGTEIRDYVVFSYEGEMYLIDRNFDMYSLSTTVGDDAELLTSNLRTILRQLGITDRCRGALVYQGRVWLIFGNYLIWSSTNGNITQYVAEAIDITTGATIRSNAGYQQIREATRIDGLAESGRNMYLFLNNGRVWKTETYSVGSTFGFRPIESNINFLGGVITTRIGVMFLAQQGVYIFNGDELVKKSEPLGDFSNLTSDDILNPLVIGDDVFWTVRGTGEMIIYNMVYDTISKLPTNDLALAALRDARTTFGTATYTWGNANFTWGEASPAVDFRYFSIAKDGDTYYLKEFGLPLVGVIQFNIRLDGLNERTFFRTLSCAQAVRPNRRPSNFDTLSLEEKIRITGFAIRYKGRKDTGWSNYRFPNGRGEVNIQRPINGPDIEISFAGNPNLTMIEIDITSGRK